MQGKSLTIKALLDTGAEDDFISNCYLCQQGIKLQEESVHPLVRLRYADGTPAPYYGQLPVKSQITDWDYKTREFHVGYHITDIQSTEYQAILGRRWMRQADTDLVLTAGTWRYRAGTPKVTLERPERFSKTMRNTLTMMVMFRPEADGEPEALPPQYAAYASVFSETEAAELPSEKASHAIPLIDGGTPPHGPLYSLSQNELRVLREYLDKMLGRGWIRPSTSAAGAPVLFVRKADGSLRLCVDYRGLNAITAKNRYLLPRIDELMDRLVGAKYFTKLDLRDAYHRIRIRRGDEWKTAFRTRYGYFEYTVMPFGLCNTPATFQAYINKAMKGILDEFYVVYLDDILIYSQTAEEHERHVNKVLARLQRANLYAKLSKCRFHQAEVRFLGFIVGRNGIRIDPDRVRTVGEWPTPQSYHDIQVFLGFTGYFRRFIHQYGRITKPLSDMLKGMEQGKKKGPFQLTERARDAFEELKSAFNGPPILRHFDPDKQIKVITDASGFAIAGILLQPVDGLQDPRKQADWQPVAFYSRKLTEIEGRYPVHDQELLAIVECFKTWRHYLEGAPQAIRVQSDHENLKYFWSKKVKKLDMRQARWAELLAAYDFEIEYRPGRLNPADAPSRRKDYEPAQKWLDAGLLPTLQRKLGGREDSRGDVDPLSSEDALTEKSRGPELLSLRTLAREAASTETPCGTTSHPLRDAILQAQTRDAYASRIRDSLLSEGGKKESEHTVDDEETSGDQSDRWRVDGGLLWHGEAIYVPPDAALRQEILRVHHNDPWAGHFGQGKTLDLVKRKFYWNRLRTDVEAYVQDCPICQKMKVPRRLPQGKLSSLPVPNGIWQDLTMDFITSLPPSARKGEVFDAILVVVDRYTKAARYLPTTSSINAEELADLFLTEIAYKTGTPRSLVTDRGSLFTSGYWSQFCQGLRIKARLSTAFHPQTDGQTERQNQTLETYLRTYTNFQQSDWVNWLLAAEFAYNNAKNASTGFSPFMAWQGENPIPPGMEEITPTMTNESIESRLRRMANMCRKLEEHLRGAVARQATYYNKRHAPTQFHVDQEVLLSTKNLRSWRPNKKLDIKYEGPFRIVEAVGKQAY